MNKIKLIVNSTIILFTVGTFTMCSNSKAQDEDKEPLSVRRGKISEKTKMDQFDIWQKGTIPPDSLTVVGYVHDIKTGDSLELVSKRIPFWFRTGKDTLSNTVEYKKIPNSNPAQAKITVFYRKGRISKKINSKHWICVLKKNRNSRAIKILIKDQNSIPNDIEKNCKNGDLVDYKIIDRGTMAELIK